MRAPGAARSALAYAITRPDPCRIYPDASKLAGYAVQADASLDEITSAAIPDQSRQGLAGFRSWAPGARPRRAPGALPVIRQGGRVMHLTPRELDKLLIYMLAEVALKRKQQGLKLNHPEAIAVITAAALDCARAGKTLEEVMTLASKILTRADVMDGVADMIPRVQLEAVFDDGSRLITVHSPIQ